MKGSDCMFNIGEIVNVYDNVYDRMEDAELINIRYEVPSSFDKYIYPVLYDVRFLHDNRISKGHLEVNTKTK
jgi:hypothetical protein